MEKPNLTYVDALSRGDKLVKNNLIQIIKTEFFLEKMAYYKSLKNKDFKKIETNVHKIKHKISILGFVKRYKMANDYEHYLRDHQLIGAKDFEKTIIAISEYLKII
tara:strand:- start:2388 stop:2705 length:318 start_codon:yes stop_codon:yes gene_type:complete